MAVFLELVTMEDATELVTAVLHKEVVVWTKLTIPVYYSIIFYYEPIIYYRKKVINSVNERTVVLVVIHN